jgi:putative transposase
MLTAWKKTEELAYRNDVSCVPLQQALRHLQTAFTRFFGKRAKYPRFKSRKKSRKSAEYTTSAFRFRDGTLTLAKMTEPLDIVWSRPLPEGASPSTVTVSQDAAGRWYVSLLCEDPSIRPLPTTDAAVGIDVGLAHLLTLSTGEKVSHPRHERRDRARLAKAHENQTIVIEDLAVRNMVKNGRLARAISDAAWSDAGRGVADDGEQPEPHPQRPEDHPERRVEGEVGDDAGRSGPPRPGAAGRAVGRAVPRSTGPRRAASPPRACPPRR